MLIICGLSRGLFLPNFTRASLRRAKSPSHSHSLSLAKLSSRYFAKVLFEFSKIRKFSFRKFRKIQFQKIQKIQLSENSENSDFRKFRKFKTEFSKNPENSENSNSLQFQKIQKIQISENSENSLLNFLKIQKFSIPLGEVSCR